MIVLTFANKAEATLSGTKSAIARAQVALNSTICHSMPISSWDRMRFFQGGHIHLLSCVKCSSEAKMAVAEVSRQRGWYEIGKMELLSKRFEAFIALKGAVSNGITLALVNGEAT